MYGCESWTIKKAECWRTDAFVLWCWRRLSRVPWTARSKPVNPKRNQPWIFIGRTDAEAKTPILWPTDAMNWLIGKDHDAGKDWRQEEKGMTEDEMDGWHHWLYGHEFEQAAGVGDGQGSLVRCSPWGHKESDTTEQLNWMLPKLQLDGQGKVVKIGRLYCFFNFLTISACSAIYYLFPFITINFHCIIAYTVVVVKLLSHVWLFDPIYHSLPASSVHGISQAKILEWVAISSSRGLLDPGIEPGSPALQAYSLPTKTT